MILQQSALRQGRPAGGRNIRCWNYFGNDNSRFLGEHGRGLANKSIQDSQLKEALAREHVKDLENREKAKKKAKALDKDFFISVLGSSATKREARSYIQRFTPPEEVPSATATAKPAPQSQPCGVNLGGFYGPAAVTRSPKFVQQPEKLARDTAGPQLHVALVKIRAPQTLDHITLDGIGKTLAQLARLGLVSVVVVDCNNSGPPSGEGISNKDWKTAEIEQANRLIAAIDANGDTGARLMDNIIGVSEEPARPGFGHTRAHVSSRNLLMVPLRRNIIPVIPSIGYSDAQQIAVPVLATDVVLALTRELAGLSLTISLDGDLKVSQTKLHDVRREASLDRLIVLDPLGGVPSTDRDNGYHVFLNMEQEFEPTKQDLLKGLYPQMDQSSLKAQPKEESSSDLGPSNLLSKFVEVGDPKPLVATPSEETTAKPKAENWYHLQNLQLVRGVLSMLPTSSSALLTTPGEAANSSNDAPFQAARVGTRRQRNPLIHNLLTDKPVFSSSLPVGRLSQQTSATENLSPAESITPTTFAKHGMSVSIFPDPSISPWQPPIPGQPKLTLTDSAIDLPRLVHLIEDSFGRKLDVQGYLNRVNSRIAGVIIAGEYEGGALLTWETPPGVPDDGLPSNRARMVPYLDKFAVLKRAQGSGGVADLIFNAMVRNCFPQGCVWRSRRNNPVNKWYFERSRGTWKVPETGWTMFWTTPDLSLDRQRFGDYESVCKSIEPSWADNKQVLD